MRACDMCEQKIGDQPYVAISKEQRQTIGWLLPFPVWDLHMGCWEKLVKFVKGEKDEVQ